MIKKPLPGDNPKKMYKERKLDRIHRFLMAGDTVRGYLVRGSRVVREIKANHSFGPLETHLMGQASLGALLMAANLKDEGRIRLQWECGGPVGGISVEADSHGTVRGYLQNSPIVMEEGDDGRYPDLFGPGFLTVTRVFEGKAEPRNSTVALQYGTIAKDLTAYHLESEQAPTAMALSVAFDKEGNPTGAGGLFLQALPGAPEEVIEGLEGTLENFPSLGEAFAEGKDAEALILDLFAPQAPRFIDSKRVEFFCPCDSGMFERYLKGLSEEDRIEIREKGPFPLEITCQNCSSVYHFEESVIRKLLS
ncbi:MAG: Hsp33 family molecular chaperone HslO [Spirochaetes bacterium]|nr:MAG: Hsp33 family molecular chaperone HslO [Spirochaetota bacterium]